MRKLIGSHQQVAHYDLTNHKGRLFYVTDVHGSFTKLGVALREVAFSPANGDLLFSSGDWVDRGPESAEVLDWLCEPWVHSSQGNHEEMHIQAFTNQYNYRYCHNAATLAQHGGLWAFDLERKVQRHYIEMFKSLPMSMELDTKWGKVGIIHAECPYGDWDMWKDACKTEFDNHCVADAQWARRKYKARDQSVVKGVDLLLVGHTPTKSYKPEVLGNVVYGDCGIPWGQDVQLIEINENLVKGVNHARERHQEVAAPRRTRSQCL